MFRTMFFYKNIFYKKIEAEICEIFQNKPEAESLKRTQFCVWKSVVYVFNITVENYSIH